MRSADIKARFLGHFERNGHTVVPERATAVRGPEPAVRQRRHGAVRAVLHRPAGGAVAAGDEHPEVHPHPGHRRGRQDHPARHVLPDERQLQLRRLLQAGRHRAGLGPVDEAGRGRRFRAGRRTHLAHRVPRRRRGVRHLAARHRHPARTASCAAAKRTTPGTWASPARRARAASCSTTAGTTTARRAVRRSTRTATWSSGTSSSWSTSAAGRPARTRATTTVLGDLPKKNIDTGMGMERMAALLQGVDNLYEIDETKPDPRPRRRSSPARSTARTPGTPRASRTRTTCGCASSPTTSAPALMLIGDGVTPGNDGRGYVLRRILRRAIRAMRLLGVRGSGAARVAAGGARLHGAVLPRTGHGLRAHLHLRLRRGGRVPAHAARRHDDLRHRGRRHQAARRQAARRRAGVPAARHLRLPDRPHHRDGGRAGPRHRRGRLPPADGRAAGAGQGRREGEEDRPPRPVGVPDGAATRARSSSPATPR